ncbi:hypothetical protein EVAR_62506_1 [Eumeta japonica]|uniref:Uncharacterized protein n=1 Tax=Eumeta variegata TaxID=151549 RepID=A0A4C1SFM1_EUMVA|nr:hypothetical protein EVAR_62506_1 [Eumeta japonica]
MIHTYLFIYSFNIAVAVAVRLSFGAVCRMAGSCPAPAPARSRWPARPPDSRPPDCQCCRSLLSLALGIRRYESKRSSEIEKKKKFFSSSISLAADRLAGWFRAPPPYPAHRTAPCVAPSKQESLLPALSPCCIFAYTNEHTAPDVRRPTRAFRRRHRALLRVGIEPPPTIRRLQRAIDELDQWFRLWRIDVNPDSRQLYSQAIARVGVTLLSTGTLPT